MGRANRIVKKTSHITVVVEEYEPAAEVKPHGTKAKPRPTFGPVKVAKKKVEAKVAEVEEVVMDATVEETAPEVHEEVVEQVTEPVTDGADASEETKEN